MIQRSYFLFLVIGRIGGCEILFHTIVLTPSNSQPKWLKIGCNVNNRTKFLAILAENYGLRGT